MNTVKRILMWIAFVFMLGGTLYAAYQIFIANDGDDDDDAPKKSEPTDPTTAAAAAKAREAKEAKRRAAMTRDATDAEILDNENLNGKEHEKATEMAEGT